MKDLFQYQNELPNHIQAILRQFNDLELDRGIQYTDLVNLGKELANYGYEFEFYLDCVPYNLKKVANIYNFNVYDYNNQKVEFKTKAKYRHIAYEKAHKKFPNSLLIELNNTLNN